MHVFVTLPDSWMDKKKNLLLNNFGKLVGACHFSIVQEVLLSIAHYNLKDLDEKILTYQ